MSQLKQQADELARIRKGIENIILKYVPNVESLSNVGAEQCYRLPIASSDTFEYIFRVLEIQKCILGIAEYGISVTTLEEVFLRVDRHDLFSEAMLIMMKINIPLRDSRPTFEKFLGRCIHGFRDCHPQYST